MPNPDPSYVKAGDPVTASGYNNIVASIRRLDNSTPRQPLKGIASAVQCPFGKLTTHDGKGFILGGIVYAGDKNFVVEDYEYYPNLAGTWLVSIQLDVEANRDDQHEIILPGIKTSSDTPEFMLKTWTEGTNYDDNTNPDVSDGIGTIVVPIGKLILEGTSEIKAVTFEPVRCGDIFCDQCGGILTHERV
jgi:hypothetical protein